MTLRDLLPILGASLACVGCDPVPNLYVVADATEDASTTDASVDAPTADASVDATVDAGTVADSTVTDGADGGDGAPNDAGPEACVTFSCPACPPNPGECCPNGIPCVGSSCATDCNAGCTSCVAGEMCCTKNGAAPAMCRVIDGGKCP